MSTGKSFKKARNDEFNRRVKECTDALEKQYHDVFEEGNKKCAALEEVNTILQEKHAHELELWEKKLKDTLVEQMTHIDKIMNRNLWQRLINRSV